MSRDSTSHSAPGPEPKPRLGILAVVVIVMVAIAFYAGWLPRRRQTESVAQITRELAELTVTLVSPGAGQAATPITLPAEIRALTESPIYARATGYIRRWTVDIGASVTNGQVLAELETPELNEDLATARAQARQAEATATLAKTTAARWTQLAEARLVSQQETEEKLADYRLRIAAAEAAQANVQRLETLAGYAQIRAPFDGTITARRVDQGQLVTAGNAAELFHLAQTHTLRVYVHVPQTLARSVAVGQTAEVLLNERPNQKYPARVVRTAGVLEAASRTLLVELELANEDASVLPGGYAQVRFPEAQAESMLTVPSNTLLFRPAGPLVGLVSNGVVELSSVALGRDFGANVEITRGLTLQDRLILNPPDSLTAGTHVRVAETNPSAR